MTLVPGDKIISIPTGAGPVLVKVGAITPEDKVVSIPTATGPVLVPVESVSPGDKVVFVPDSSGKRIALKTGASTPETQLTDIAYLGSNILITCGLSSGVFYRSTDLGVIWTRTALAHFGLNLTLYPNFYRFCDLGSGVVLAGTGVLSGSGMTMQIWKSINYGLTWTLKATLSSSTGFDMGSCANIVEDAAAPGTVFAIAQSNGSLWKSTDSGDTWATIHEFWGAKLEYFNWSGLATTTTGHVFCGVCDADTDKDTVYQSDNGGVTFVANGELIAYNERLWMVETRNPAFLFEVFFNGDTFSENWGIGEGSPASLLMLSGWHGDVKNLIFVPESVSGSDIGWYVCATNYEIITNDNQHAIGAGGAASIKKVFDDSLVGGLCHMTHFTFFLTYANGVYTSTDKGTTWTLVKAL